MAVAVTPQTNHIREVNRLLDDYFALRVKDAAAVSPYYQALWQEIWRLVQSGGKRLRPTFTLLMYSALGGEDVEAIVPVATAQELLHVSMLIHDDIIDRDYIRYGVDNVAGRYAQMYKQFVGDSDERRHYAHSAALLAGDLLISGSYEMIANSRLAPAKSLEVQRLLARSIFEVAGGELLDTEATFRPLGSISALSVAHYKTASYSFVGPLLIGATLAGASHEDMVSVRQFGQNAGIAFQLRDDIIGIFGDTERTGKTTTGDVREGKRTYMIEQFLRLANDKQQREFAEHFGRATLSDDGASRVRELLSVSGALQQTEAAIASYAAEARRALGNVQLRDDAQRQFDEILTFATKRES